MSILSMQKFVDWKHLPWATLLLIVLNLAVFQFSHSLDTKQYQKATDFYWTSPLSSIELPKYLESLQQRGDSQKLEKLKQLLNNPNQSPEYKESLNQFVMSMNYDQSFMEPLRAEKLILPENQRFSVWRKARSVFDELFLKTVTNQYGFTPVSPNASGLFAHLFLHNDTKYLIGNMVLLFLIGFALEKSLGCVRYFCAYIFTGVGAAGCFWLADQHSIIPLLGASSAIAGLIGVCIGIFGIQKIPFLCFSGVRAPLLIMLVWMTNVYYHFTYEQGKYHTFLADISGFVLGVAIGLVIKNLFTHTLNLGFLDNKVKYKNKELRYNQALTALNQLDLAHAQALFFDLYRDFPDDKEILQQYYKVCRYSQQSVEYRNLVRKILSSSDEDSCSSRLLREAFADYYMRPEEFDVSPSVLIKLAIRFCRVGYLADAENIVNMLMTCDYRQRKGLDNAMLVLANVWLKKGNLAKSQGFHQMVLLHYPRGEAARYLKQQMDSDGKLSSNYADL
ncbi:rhomboid family intramembrane serine protease [Methylomonas sp. AM2-LC]|uniref:rhomboid family intramembrane serine protease n=1 Tax=Methylomonas sp. AM2-LC TaxID=3153301 RepID=UPI00326422AC